MEKFILFFLVLINFIKSEIKLPFKRIINNKISPQKFMNELRFNKIYIEDISVGNPPQKIKLQIKLQDYSTFLISEKASINFKNNYNESKSNSIKIYDETPLFLYGFSLDSGYKISEIFEFKNLFKIDLKCYLATSIDLEIGIESEGILGLKLKSSFVDKISEETNFVEQLKKNNIINKYPFTIKYKDNINGDLIIGGKPDEYDNKNYHENNFLYTKVTQIDGLIDWGLKFTKGNFGKDEIPYFKELCAQFKLENGVFISSKGFLELVEKRFFNFYIQNNKCNKSLSNDNFTYYFYCDKDINIKKFDNLNFYMKDLDFTFTFTYEDLFYEYKNKYYFLVLFTDVEQCWEFGFPFFKKYQIVFDQDKKIIGFYKKNLSEETSKTLIILLIILIVSLILFIGFCLKKHNKKIKAKELENIYDNNLKKYISLQ